METVFFVIVIVGVVVWVVYTAITILQLRDLVSERSRDKAEKPAAPTVLTSPVVDYETYRARLIAAGWTEERRGVFTMPCRYPRDTTE